MICAAEIARCFGVGISIHSMIDSVKDGRVVLSSLEGLRRRRQIPQPLKGWDIFRNAEVGI
jgi:hypothetical protein